MTAKSTLTLSDQAWPSFRPGQLVATGNPPDYEYLRVVSVDGSELTVVRWRWWHTAMAKPGVWWRKYRRWLDAHIIAFEDWREARRRP